MGEVIDFRKKFQEKLKPSEAGLESEPEMQPVEVPPEEGPDAGTLDGGEADQTEAEEGQHQEAEMETAEETPCKSRNQVDQIIDLAGKQVDFFHTADWEISALRLDVQLFSIFRLKLCGFGNQWRFPGPGRAARRWPNTPDPPWFTIGMPSLHATRSINASPGQTGLPVTLRAE